MRPPQLLPGLATTLLLHGCQQLPAATALDNGLALTPPLGWRTYNAFGGDVSQALMEEMMEAMVDRGRLVGGKPTSLLDLGYKRVGLDGVPVGQCPLPLAPSAVCRVAKTFLAFVGPCAMSAIAEAGLVSARSSPKHRLPQAAGRAAARA